MKNTRMAFCISLLMLLAALSFSQSTQQIHIKKFHKNRLFNLHHFSQIDEDIPCYKAYIYNYDSEEQKTLLIPDGTAPSLDDEPIASLSNSSIRILFSQKGNDGFEYQSFDQNSPGQTHLHIGITRVKGNSFSPDYHVSLNLDNKTWTFKAKATDDSRYIFGDSNNLIEMQSALSSSPFAVDSSNRLLAELMARTSDFSNFSQLVNILCLAIGPQIVQYHMIDNINFYVQAEYVYLSCDSCYVTCYDEPTPTLVIGETIISCRNIKIFPNPLPPPQPQPCAQIGSSISGEDSLNYLVQDYPNSLTPIPNPSAQSASLPPPLPAPNNDAFHTSLFTPCLGEINLSDQCTKKYGSRGDFSTYCPTTIQADGSLGHFYRVVLDLGPNNNNTVNWPNGHEMYEVYEDKIMIKRESYKYQNPQSSNEQQCQQFQANYRHHNNHIWLPRYLYTPMFFIVYTDEYCCKSSNAIALNNSCTIASSLSPNCLLAHEQPDPSIYPCSGLPVCVTSLEMQIPDPNNSKEPSYCSSYNPDFPASCSGLELRNIYMPSGVCDSVIGNYCYTGPTKTVKAIKRKSWYGGQGTCNLNLGQEIYYYAVDKDNPTITWGYIKYEQLPGSQNPGINTIKSYHSTKYPPDLKPYIPDNAEEKY